MLKKLGIPVIVLAAVLAFSPKPAEARIHFGVYVGGPAYVAPLPGPYYYSPYAYGPYYPAPYYAYPPVYGYGPSYYSYPYYRGYYGRGYAFRREFHGGREFNHGGGRSVGRSFGRSRR